MTINWVFIGVIGIIGLCAWKGKKAGFVKSIFSICSVMLSLVGAVLIGPIIKAFLWNNQVVMMTFQNGNEQITSIILNAISFVLAYVIARIIVFIVCLAMDIVAKLPILHQVNEIAGFLIGTVEGLINVWIIFIILNIFYDTSWGSIVLAMVHENSFLFALYENNMIYMIWDIL